MNEDEGMPGHRGTQAGESPGEKPALRWRCGEERRNATHSARLLADFAETGAACSHSARLLADLAEIGAVRSHSGRFEAAAWCVADKRRYWSLVFQNAGSRRPRAMPLAWADEREARASGNKSGNGQHLLPNEVMRRARPP